MLFNSFNFLVFYIVILLAYFAMPQRQRWILLLLASYFFYMCWRPSYALILLALTALCYIAALAIDSSLGARARRLWLLSSIIGCVGLLAAFKYIDPLLATVNVALGAMDVSWKSPLLHLMIPVGISFHVLQSIGCVTDVYRGTCRAERHFGIYALFIAFFPQLLAGPIERSSHMLPQFHAQRAFSYARLRSGGQWVLWGLFKKMVIADGIAAFVNNVYADPRHAGGGTVLCLATFFFAIQIYCDFSGYSDIAVGVARIMGYDLLINFRQPYLSTTLSQFWTRWHVSLSTWFRDYIYIPLGGSRAGAVRWAGNLLLVFLISGLWRGNTLLFGLWGLVHATYLLVGRLTQNVRSRLAVASGLTNWPTLHAILGIISVFTLVTIAWIFFRARSLDDVGYILAHIPRLNRLSMDQIYLLGLPRFEFATSLAVILLLIVVDGCIRFRPSLPAFAWRLRSFRWACYTACTYAIVFFGVFDHIEFIYFQF